MRVVVGPTPLSGGPGLESYERNLPAMGRLFQEWGAQVVVSNTLQAFYAIDAAHLAGIPSIWIIHEARDGAVITASSMSAWRSVLSPASVILTEWCLSRRLRAGSTPSSTFITMLCSSQAGWTGPLFSLFLGPRCGRAAEQGSASEMMN